MSAPAVSFSALAAPFFKYVRLPEYHRRGLSEEQARLAPFAP